MNGRRPVIFWGATGQAKVLRECLKSTFYELVALFDNNPDVSSPFSGVPIYYGTSGFEAWRREHPDMQAGFLVAIGGDRGKDRMELHAFLENAGLTPIVARHPTAFVADDAIIGVGSQILAGAIVNVEAVIGKSCIINTSATMDHECRLEDGVHICPGAHLAGNVHIGRYAMVGTGASVLPGIRIGEGARIGAGAVVTRDVESHATVVGNPARVQ